MGYVNINGNPIGAVNLNGLPINAVNLDGDVLTGTSDYNDYSTEYERTILSVRDSMMAEASEDDCIPLLISTDQHGYLNTAHKTTFDYLNLAIPWNEVSAIVNIGDTCSGSYRETELSAFKNCMSSIRLDKQINVMGNHDVWLAGKVTIDGAEYSAGCIDNQTLEYSRDTYFNNSHYGNQYEYAGLTIETMIDEPRRVRYITAGGWNFPDGIYYHYNLTTEAVSAIIDYLSRVDNYDVVFISHCQPIIESKTWVHPAVDDEAQSEISKTWGYTGSLGYNISLLNMLVDRKNKQAGTITDSQGVVHQYDFTACTSDILCTLHGHEHIDYYTVVDGMPIILFDAYRYDNAPMFMLNINRDREIVDIWKYDESCNVYNYQIPMLT